MQLFNHPLLVRCSRKSNLLQCKAKNVFISGYSTGDLVNITAGLPVGQAGDRISCPDGYKVWSPRNKADWTAVYSAMDMDINKYPGKSGMIVDVFRTQDGCGDCADYAMNSNVSEQSSWQTSDYSAWWLRDTPYNVSGDGYKANKLLRVTDVNPNDVKFAFSANPVQQLDYLCQRAEGTATRSSFVGVAFFILVRLLSPSLYYDD